MSSGSRPAKQASKRLQGRGIALAFSVSALSSLALTVVYALGGQPQAEGALLFTALGGIGVGLILWGKDLMPGGGFVQEREIDLGERHEREIAFTAFEEGGEAVERRSFLGKMLGAALGALGVAALFPIRSLGSAPEDSLQFTAWAAGSRVVTVDNEPVRPEDLSLNGVLTVFPEHHTDSGNTATLLIHLDPGSLKLSPERLEWAPEGFVGFSKICTHAGCPVGLYQATSNELLCPCHQSVFSVLDGARPTHGPATRPLPQLPLMIDEDGYLAAQGDFPEPVGPGYWNRDRAEG